MLYSWTVDSIPRSLFTPWTRARVDNSDACTRACRSLSGQRWQQTAPRQGMGQKRSRQPDNDGGRPADAPRKQGVLRDWKHNDNAPHSFERGYGFIAPDGGTSDMFVHATALRTVKGMAIAARVEYTEFRDEHQRPQA